MADKFTLQTMNTNCQATGQYECNPNTGSCLKKGGGPQLSMTKRMGARHPYYEIRGDAFTAELPEVQAFSQVCMMQKEGLTKLVRMKDCTCSYSGKMQSLRPYVLALSQFGGFAQWNFQRIVDEIKGSSKGSDLNTLVETANYFLAVQSYIFLKKFGKAPQGVQGKRPDGHIDRELFIKTFVSAINQTAQGMGLTCRAQKYNPDSIYNTTMSVASGRMVARPQAAQPPAPPPVQPVQPFQPRPVQTTTVPASSQSLAKYVDILLNFYSYTSSPPTEAMKAQARAQITQQITSEARTKGSKPVDVAKYYLAGNILRILRTRGISLSGLQRGGDYVSYLIRLLSQLKTAFAIPGYTSLGDPDTIFKLTGEIVKRAGNKTAAVLGLLRNLNLISTAQASKAGGGRFNLRLVLTRPPNNEQEAFQLRGAIKTHIQNSLGTQFDADTVLKNISLTVEIGTGTQVTQTQLARAFRGIVNDTKVNIRSAPTIPTPPTAPPTQPPTTPPSQPPAGITEMQQACQAAINRKDYRAARIEADRMYRSCRFAISMKNHSAAKAIYNAWSVCMMQIDPAYNTTPEARDLSQRLKSITPGYRLPETEYEKSARILNAYFKSRNVKARVITNAFTNEGTNVNSLLVALKREGIEEVLTGLPTTEAIADIAFYRSAEAAQLPNPSSRSVRNNSPLPYPYFLLIFPKGAGTEKEYEKIISKYNGKPSLLVARIKSVF